jgi:hypothetical protein
MNDGASVMLGWCGVVGSVAFTVAGAVYVRSAFRSAWAQGLGAAPWGLIFSLFGHVGSLVAVVTSVVGAIRGVGVCVQGPPRASDPGACGLCTVGAFGVGISILTFAASLLIWWPWRAPWQGQLVRWAQLFAIVLATFALGMHCRD